ncbi:Ribosome biogenesis protein ENP2 [Cyphellophora attinorum]|uniref:Ribosome biogenesis protein ENP2 n=1 Tax=Cyphellophora attinorum TaxID=1664694 RepID=A0A0N0NLW7_9EURO|nr:Ribosome biogenesis protein ENP2 [Phialophora attinorum]KPI39519.1 Ribosome biogenesis protein ENP2 [Phialophora attinorum]
MKLTNSSVPVYTVSGSNISQGPDWQAPKKRKNKDPEYANRVELLQDFEFEEASQCVRISEDGDWVMSTGTYKPQIHTHYLPNLSLSWARHTDTLNKKFVFLSTDYSKTVHLQEDRSVELHTPGGRHHALRIPRYGRDLAYNKAETEILIPSVGVNANGLGEVFRVSLEYGRFMEPYEVDVGGNETVQGLQGGVSTGAVNSVSIAEGSHGLMAFGTTLGTIEYWDARSRARVATLALPVEFESRPEVTALDFHHSGISVAAGTSSGLTYLYDLRSALPTLRKEHGYGYPIQHVEYLNFSSSTKAATTEQKIMVADRRIIKLWDERSGVPWTSVEPAVDINSVAWCRDSGMFLTANEGRAQHAFFIPQLGPAPRWCSFLDNVVEEMADDPNDPLAYNRKAGEVYENHKFLTESQLRTLNIDHLIGKTNLLRPYMHGYFVDQKLYDEARLITNPTSWEEERAKRVQQKIDKERESRIRGKKKIEAKVNRKMVEKILDREEKNERRRAQRVLAQGGDANPPQTEPSATTVDEAETEPKKPKLLGDSRFASLFQDAEFEIDENSREFQNINPSTKVDAQAPRSNLDLERGLTAVEEEMLDEVPNSSASDGEDSDDDPFRKSKDKISTADYKRRDRSKKDRQKDSQRRRKLEMRVSNSSNSVKGGLQQRQQRLADQSFGARVLDMPVRESRNDGAGGNNGKRGVIGDKMVTFEPTRKPPKSRFGQRGSDDNNDNGRKGFKGGNDRRSASGNTFRRM